MSTPPPDSPSHAHPPAREDAPEGVRNRRPAIPKLILALRTYTYQTFTADLTAGITVGLVALPLAMAFAISSGLPPESGLYCAIITGFLISALGGSMVQIGGPTGAFVVVVSSIVAQYGVEGLFMCTMMGGVILVILGATGMGQAIRFIPRPVVVGFTNGIAIIIASTQIKDFLGLSVVEMPGDFARRMMVLARSLPTIAPAATALAVSVLVVLVLCARRKTRVPGTLIALFGGTVVAALAGLPVDTIESRFHGIPSGLPDLQLPAFRVDLVLALLTPAFTVALLGGIESLMSAVVADRMTGDRHNPNVELVAQGIANIASPLFGGLPATGALARTATNVRSGARTPVSGIVHALTLLMVVLFAAPLAGFIPMPVLAAILMMVAWNMGDWGEIPEVFRMSLTDGSVWLVTLLLTVFADLTQAVEVGMALAALLFIQRVSTTTDVAQVTEEFVARSRADMLQDKPIPAYTAIFRVTGPLLFGSTDKLDVVTDRLDGLPPIVILRLRYMTAIDATGLHALEDLADAVRRTHRVFLVSGAREQPRAAMIKARFEVHVGSEHVCATYDEALERAERIYRERFSGAWPELKATVTGTGRGLKARE